MPEIKVFIISVIPICDVIPASILDISIASNTLILHRHNTQSRIIDITTGFNNMLEIMNPTPVVY